jgi:hypothetical protein
MSRQSAESKADAMLRAGSAPPKPPKHLPKAAAAIWLEIAASKPADFFDVGAQPLLEQYCLLIVHARAMNRRMERLVRCGKWDDLKPWEKRRNQLNASLATLATKLRLSIQALVDRRSRGLLERGAQPGAKPDPLLGGRAVWGEGAGSAAKPN